MKVFEKERKIKKVKKKSIWENHWDIIFAAIFFIFPVIPEIFLVISIVRTFSENFNKIRLVWVIAILILRILSGLFGWTLIALGIVEFGG